MRKVVIATATVLAFATAASAGPKDKGKSSLVNPTAVVGSAEWDNTTYVAVLKQKTCQLMVQFKNATGLIGQKIVCIASADIFTQSLGLGPYGNSVVMAGTVNDKGKLKIKAKLGPIGCGDDELDGDTVTFNPDTRCYLDAGDYTDPDDLKPGQWKQVCSNSGTIMVALPLIGTTAEEAGIKDQLLGLCQGFSTGAGERIDPPSPTTLLVQDGSNVWDDGWDEP